MKSLFVLVSLFMALPVFAAQLSCEINESARDRRVVSASYKLEQTVQDGVAARIMVFSKTLKDTVSIQTLGSTSESEIRFVVNGNKKDGYQIETISNSNKISYSGPVGKGWVTADCSYK